MIKIKSNARFHISQYNRLLEILNIGAWVKAVESRSIVFQLPYLPAMTIPINTYMNKYILFIEGTRVSNVDSNDS